MLDARNGIVTVQLISSLQSTSRYDYSGVRSALGPNLILTVIDVLSILVMSVIMVMGARMTFRLLRGGIWARPARIILLAGSFYYLVRVVDLFDDLFGFMQAQSYIVFNNATSLVFSVLFFIAIYELYQVLKRLVLPAELVHLK